MDKCETCSINFLRIFALEYEGFFTKLDSLKKVFKMMWKEMK